MVSVDDGREPAHEVLLDSPTVGVYMPGRWSGAPSTATAPDAVLLVLASLPYDPDDYIRDYDEFLAAAQG